METLVSVWWPRSWWGRAAAWTWLTLFGMSGMVMDPVGSWGSFMFGAFTGYAYFLLVRWPWFIFHRRASRRRQRAQQPQTPSDSS